MSPTAVLAASEQTVIGGINEAIANTFGPISDAVGAVIFFTVPVGGFDVQLIVVWLIAAAVIFSLYFGFVQFRGFKTAIETVRGTYSRDDDPGEISHFRALTSAVSGTVGLGNIAGVGAAVTLGGPGATFWMILAGLLGMCTKFAECTLGVKYREVHEDGTVTGGPFKYLPVAFKRFGAIPARVLTGVFAIALLLFGIAGGNMFQANQTFAQARSVTGGDTGFLGSDAAALFFGIVLAALVGAVIIGGIKSIGAVTSRLVPSMALIYVAACLVVIVVNIDHVPAAFGEIVGGAFSPEGVTGGVIGVMIIGFQRAAFSNEAGVGSSPIAHSAVKTRRPVSEGFVALLEPLIDTVVVCTMTALTIIIAAPQFYADGRATVAEGGDAPDGVLVTSAAFETVLPWFPYILAVAVGLFAFSTLITWSYYSQKAWTTLFGETTTSENVFKGVFLVFTVIGTVLTFTDVVNFADAMLFLCALVNLFGVYLLLPVIKREMKAYFADRKSGKLAEDALTPGP